MKNQPDPKLRDGIIEATSKAAALANQARLDRNLNPETASTLAEAWEKVVHALTQSRTPDKDVPGSEAEWAYRQKIIQEMVNEIRAAEQSIRSSGAPDVCAKLKAKLAELQAKLDVGQEKVPAVIDFGRDTLPNYITGAVERKEFADYAARQIAWAKKAGLCR